MINQFISTELTFFYLDFSNQIIPVAEAAGGQGSTTTASLVNGGATVHRGLEAAIDLDLRPLFSTWGVGINSNITFVNAEFSEDRFISTSDGAINVKGNTLPYAPEMMISSNLAIYAPFGLIIDFNTTYLGKQFTDAQNTIPGSLNGRGGEMPSYFVLDANATYNVSRLPGASLSLSVKNLLDERYIVSRRPQGIRVGMPRFISFGVDYKF